MLANTPYSFKVRIENEKGTHPEELIAAAHAGCFAMALALRLRGAGNIRASLVCRAGHSGYAGRIQRCAATGHMWHAHLIAVRGHLRVIPGWVYGWIMRPRAGYSHYDKGWRIASELTLTFQIF